MTKKAGHPSGTRPLTSRVSNTSPEKRLQSAEQSRRTGLCSSACRMPL